MIVFISCSKKKIRANNLPARELYSASDLFRKSYSYARRLGQVYIVSSKYGIIQPEDKIDYYEKTINKMRRVEIERLKEKVNQQLREKNISGKVTSLMGKKYNDLIDGLDVLAPLSGMGIGKRLRWLKEKNGQGR